MEKLRTAGLQTPQPHHSLKLARLVHLCVAFPAKLSLSVTLKDYHLLFYCYKLNSDFTLSVIIVQGLGRQRGSAGQHMPT